jgi:hypothetical protein
MLKTDLGSPPQLVCPLAPSAAPGPEPATNTPTAPKTSDSPTSSSITEAPTRSRMTDAPSVGREITESPTRLPVDAPVLPTMIPMPVNVKPTCPPIRSPPTSNKSEPSGMGESNSNNEKPGDRKREKYYGSMAKLSDKKDKRRRLGTGSGDRTRRPNTDCPDQPDSWQPPSPSTTDSRPSGKSQPSPVSAPIYEKPKSEKSVSNIFDGGKGATNSNKGDVVEPSIDGDGVTSKRSKGDRGEHSTLKFSHKKRKEKETDIETKDGKGDDMTKFKKISNRR